MIIGKIPFGHQAIYNFGVGWDLSHIVFRRIFLLFRYSWSLHSTSICYLHIGLPGLLCNIFTGPSPIVFQLAVSPFIFEVGLTVTQTGDIVEIKFTLILFTPFGIYKGRKTSRDLFLFLLDVRFLFGLHIGNVPFKISQLFFFWHFINGNDTICILHHILVGNNIFQVVQLLFYGTIFLGIYNKVGQGTVIVGSRCLIGIFVKIKFCQIFVVQGIQSRFVPSSLYRFIKIGQGQTVRLVFQMILRYLTVYFVQKGPVLPIFFQFRKIFEQYLLILRRDFGVFDFLKMGIDHIYPW